MDCKQFDPAVVLAPAAVVLLFGVVFFDRMTEKEAASSSTEEPIDADTLAKQLKAQKGWSAAVVFDEKANVKASTVENVDGQELADAIAAFGNRDQAVGRGVMFGGTHYAVHRWYETAIYGRRGDSADGEGFALVKTTNNITREPLYAIITFGFPMLTARAVPMLQEFMLKYAANLQ